MHGKTPLGQSSPQSEHDRRLARRIAGGDASGFEQLLDEYAAGLYGLAMTLLGNAADAEDAVQETVIAAFERIGDFEGRSTLKTWLTRILFNRCATMRRRRRVRRTTPLPPADASGDKALRHEDEQMAVRLDLPTMLEALSEEHRQIIVLREIEQLSYAEIADVLEIAKGTVESRLYRARQSLREQFEEYLN